ncbi:MAG: hypothetical protein ACRDQX_01850, partial [Pseudonocardiaceae bacterium]
MSDALSFVEVEGQRVELLPARTVMSLFAAGGGTAVGGSGGHGAGGLGVVASVIPVTLFGTQSNSAGDGFGGP